MKRWPTRSLLLATATVLGCLVPNLARADFKVGLDQVQLTGATYTHNDAATKPTNSTVLSGTQVTLEYLPTDNFGLELASSALPLGRTYPLGPQGAISQNVTEQASYGTFGANMYLFREERMGLHAVVGIAAGTVSVSQKFEGGTLGSVSSSNSVGINVAKLGLDWVINKAGFRLRFEQWTGEATSATKIPGVRQTNSYSGSAATLGVFSFF